MSIRFIGYESYVPVSPGNYSKGKSKVIRFSTQPHQQQIKAQKVNRYRQQLDKQVEEMRRRKQDQKQRQLLQDQRRQRQFYQSIQHAKKIQNHSPKNVRNFHFNQYESRSNVYKNYKNPEDNNKFDTLQDNFLFDSRLAQIGRKKFQLDVPVFQNRGDLILDQDDTSAQQRRRDMMDQMDKSLLGAHMAIQRSKGSVIVDEQLQRLRRRLRTQQTGIMSENDAEYMYSLPYRNYLYNSPYRYRHKREGSWM